jgi:WD40 repeat protein
MLVRRLIPALAFVLVACGTDRQSRSAGAYTATEIPKATAGRLNEPEPSSASAHLLGEGDEAALSFALHGGLTFVQRGRESYLVDASSPVELAKIESPDGSLPACIVARPDGHRFIAVFQSGFVSLWESSGRVIARSQKSIGRAACGTRSLRVSWDSKEEYFLTNFDHDPSLPSTGIWVWRIAGAALEPTLIAPGKQLRADFFAQSPGMWVERHDGSFQILALDGAVLHEFACDRCVPSPNGRALAVNERNPRRHTRLVDLTTGSARWESPVSTYLWSPSMRWIVGADDRGPLVVDGRDGRVVVRWAHPGRKFGEAGCWFGDLLVEVGGRELVHGAPFGEPIAVDYQVAFWKAGDVRPRIERGVPHEGLPEITLAHGGDRFLAANTIWSARGKLLVRLEALAPGHGFAQSWSADDRYLEGKNDEGLVIWDAATGRIASRLKHRRLEQFVRSWSLQGHDLLITEGPTLLRHTPNQGTVRITPQLLDGKLTFDVQKVVSWFPESYDAEN